MARIIWQTAGVPKPHYDNNNAGVNMASFTQAVSYQNNKITGNSVDIAGTFVNASPGER